MEAARIRTLPSSRAPLLSLLVTTLCAVGALLSGCKKPASDEDQIRAVIQEGIDALEARDLARAAATLDDDYLDEGGRDKRNMQQLAFVVTRQGRVVFATRSLEIDVQDDGDSAQVHLLGLALQGADEITALRDLLPKSGRELDLQLRLRKREGSWRVTSIQGDGLRNPTL